MAAILNFVAREKRSMLTACQQVEMGYPGQVPYESALKKTMYLNARFSSSSAGLNVNSPKQKWHFWDTL